MNRDKELALVYAKLAEIYIRRWNASGSDAMYRAGVKCLDLAIKTVERLNRLKSA